MYYYVFQNVPDFGVGYMEMRKKFNMTCQHYHTAYEVLFMTGGERYIFFNNGSYRLTAGDIVFITPYTLHLTENKESNYFRRYVLNFSDKIFKSVFDDKECSQFLKKIHNGIIHIEGTQLEFTERIFKDLSILDISKDKYSKKMLAAKMITLIDMFAYSGNYNTAYKESELIYSDNLAKTLNYINHHFTENLTLDFVVDYAHMSKATFCRIFKNETGNTFLQYLNSHRVAYAHSLLLESDMSIQSISEKTGFSSILHFERVFKNIHGITPSAIRKLGK